MERLKLQYIDLFCGAGGTSTGVENARHKEDKCAKVIACVNHDKNAIASHAANHPDALHFTEDIRTLELSPLIEHVAKMRALHPNTFIVLWASLECTNFSRAKGGKSRDADSRTLADHLFRYIEALAPDYIQIENVEEFMGWGDMDDNGKPISKDKGKSYQRWVNCVKEYGYTFDFRILNSADYGAYTSRKRFFGIFAKENLPIVFPKATHTKRPSRDLFGSGLKKWKAVREVLDLKDEGSSIFGRKKPLVDATLERIYSGLVKFVAGGKKEFLLKYNSMSSRGKYQAPSVDDPCPTIATQGRLGIAQVNFISKYYGGSPDGKSHSIEEPAGAITTIDHHSFISAYYGNGHNHSLNEPAPTLTTKDRLAFVDMQYGNGSPSGIYSPAPTLTVNPKHHLVTCSKWILNPQFKNSGSSVDKPCFTLIARMDKMPPYLMSPRLGNKPITIVSTDTQAMIKVKEFMIMYGIIDIKMRMFRIGELKLITGFPMDYILIGTQADQKKFIGNAVEVTTARVLCEALCEKLNELNIMPLEAA